MSTKIRLEKAAPLIIFFLSLIITSIWFRNGLMFGGGEEGLPFYNLSKYLSLISHIWHEYNAGYVAVHLLPRIPYFWVMTIISGAGIGPAALQAFTFCLLIFTGSLSVYLLVKELIEKKLTSHFKNIVPLISSIFYIFNPYSMSQVWSRGVYGQFFGFALVPLFLLLYVRGLNRGKVRYLVLGIFASLLFSVSYTVITQIVVLWIPVFLFFLFHVMENFKERKVVVFSIVYTTCLVLFWTLSNFWWILPTLKIGSSAYSNFLSAPGNLDTLVAVSRVYAKPEYVIRLLQGFYFFISDSYGKIYSNVSFQILSWMIPLVSLFSLNYLKKIKVVIFFITLFLVGFFISIGSNPPLGGIFLWFFKNIPYFQAFRNPYEKIGLLLPLAYAPLFALGVVILSEKLASFFATKKMRQSYLILVLTLVFGVCGVLVWPLWTGRFTNGWVEVPSYYNEADKWLSSQGRNFRIIHMPLISGDGVEYNWPFPYLGIEPSEFLFTSPSIGSNGAVNKLYYNVLLERFGNFVPGAFGPDPDITKSDFRSDKLWKELAKLNVRYVVFHNDLENWVIGSGKTVEDFKIYLEKKSNNIEKVKSFGQLDIYEVIIPPEINVIYSPDAKTRFAKVTHSYYKVGVDEAEDYEVNLNFLTLFDPNWEASVGGEKIENHARVLAYANTWKIKETTPFEVDIKFKPQYYVDIGSKISYISVLVLIFFMGISFFRKHSLFI